MTDRPSIDRKKAGPITKYCESDSVATEFKDSHDVTVFGFFDNKDKEEFKVFETAANEVPDVHFGHVFDNGIRTLMRAEKNSILLFKKFDEKRVVYNDTMSPEPLTQWVSAHSMPMVVPFNEASAPKIFGGKIKVHLIAFADAEKHKETVEKLTAPAKKFKSEIVVITVPPSEEQITEYFGISKDDMPAVRLIDMREAGMKKYIYDKPVVDEEGLEGFVDDFFKERLTATLKTEDAPVDEEGPVKTIVSTTWQKMVHENDNDVLVEFYAPWCGHCKELAPKYEALATKLAPVAEKLVIAKVNAEANEIQDVIVEGFPTIRLFAAQKKHDAIEYMGERSAEAIEAWLKDKVTHPWTEKPTAPPEDKGGAAEGQKSEL